MKGKTCYGWPVGAACENKPGSKWGPNWCQSCDEKRMVYLDGQFNKLATRKQRAKEK